MDLFILKTDVEKFTSTYEKTLHMIFKLTWTLQYHCNTDQRYVDAQIIHQLKQNEPEKAEKWTESVNAMFQCQTVKVLNRHRPNGLRR